MSRCDGPLRTVLVGFGRQAELAHLPSLLAQQERFSVVGCVDMCSARLEIAEAVVPSALMATSVEDVLGKKDVELLVITTPPSWRVQPVFAAVEHGVQRCICEKPLVRSSEELGSFLAAADCLVMVPCHTWLFSEPLKDGIRALKEGVVGLPCRAELTIRRLRPACGTKEWFPDWRTVVGISGGGVLMDLGYHCIYLLAEVFGEWPDSVSASGKLADGVERTCRLRLGYRSGREAVVVLDWDSDRRAFSGRFDGSEGILEIGEEDVTIVTKGCRRAIASYVRGLSRDGIHGDWYRAFYRSAWEIFDHDVGAAVRHMQTAVCTMEVLFGAYAALRQPGAKVTLSGLGGHVGQRSS